MAAPHNVELEAAKFLHKLIQESTDEPTKLARKLYVILQHMRSSGKENSMPYQVISRAMETVINQHGLDIESLKSSRLPLTGGSQMGDSSSAQFAGSSQTVGIAKDSKPGIAEIEVANSHVSSRPPAGPSGAGHDIYQGSVSHLSTRSLDHESPSSFETRSANSQSQERHDVTNWEKTNQNDGKKLGTKRKRADSSSATEPHIDNPQQLNLCNLNARQGKLVNKLEPPGSLSVSGNEHSQFNMVQGSGQMEHIPSFPSSMRSTNIATSMSRAANSKYPEEIEVSSAHSALGLQQGSSRLSMHDIHSSRGLWNQNRPGFALEKSQMSGFPSNSGSGNLTAEILMHQTTAPLGSSASEKVHGAAPRNSGSFPPVESVISSPMHFSGASYDTRSLVTKMNKERSKETFSSSPSVEFSANKGTVDSEHWKHGLVKGAAITPENTGEAQFFLANSRELGFSTPSSEKALEHEGGTSNVLANANKTVQGGIGMNMLRGAASRDTGKAIISQSPPVSYMPFKEQHLKQLRAQCLVFLAFRNGVMPKKLHLEIALGNFFPKEDGPHKELMDHKGKELSHDDSSNIHEDAMSFGRLDNVREGEIVPHGPSSTGMHLQENFSKELEDPNISGDKTHLPSELSTNVEEKMHLLVSRRKGEGQVLAHEIAETMAFVTKVSQPDSLSARDLAVSNHKDEAENGEQQASPLMGISKPMKPEMISWNGISSHKGAATLPVSGSLVPHESVPERKDSAPSQLQLLADCNFQGNRHANSHLPRFPSREQWKPISGTEAKHQSVMHMKDANLVMKSGSEGSKHVTEDDKRISDTQRRFAGNPAAVETGQEEEAISLSSDLIPSPKHTTSEKWIMEQHRRKVSIEQNWALKQRKAEQRISTCSEKLKETVSSSENTSAKTKSVIELKKLQLLELQRHLRSDILNDFFKPITVEMDRLKSVKKHRLGRRPKQIERYEQKMKEERQKRIRERQKEFFSEIEVHRERLEDIFKMKRERGKNINKYVREFHKRKERIQREKIDRIQREKINLLKINDVEGYLRMVQDAKSDRVKQLLKETEKYLQKLGSRLKEAKSAAKHFETDIDENRSTSVVEDSEIVVENEDEADQAKHYMESNEKYYLMAHSIKESIAEQPTCLVGGKLREYQMNGLRWLVSLYNNHLNGILADEMGLGKTVQVIALLCYLMETKNDRGPFLVVVPSSVLPGWESEINFWAPTVNRIVYSGTPEERRRLFKERIVQQKFNVLLTTYEYLMNKHDRPKLSKVHWHYIIIDEGHRIKNASCKLNADLKLYHSSHRLLLTGTPLQNNLEELWALLNFLLPNIFNSSEDFSQWFNKPFEGNGDNSADEALLSEEENLLIINRLHQVLRPFVLRRLKHKVENELPEKIERLVRCEASAYQKLLMRRVEDNLGAIGTSKARTVHNSVMELRNICNHPYLSQLHVEEVQDFVPRHYLPNIVRLCGKLEMLDRLLPKLKATDHRVLFFSTMTRLLDVMEDYLCWKQYRYLRLDGHTSGGDRGALIDQFNKSDSPFFIFLLSIRAGGVGVNLQAADTVIIFDTDWNPQVDLQAQARAHRIGQKKDVLVLRLETVKTVEEQVRASAEHKLGVANQSITAGFFDNNTSAEDRREYLESLLRECKKEEAAPVLNDDALNDLIARSESEIDIFESVDSQRREEEMAKWKNLVLAQCKNVAEPVPPLPPRLVSDDDLKSFYDAMNISEVPSTRVVSNVGTKRKGGNLGGLDTQHYGRGKRAREVRSYEEQWTEEEFEKLCQADSPDSPKLKEEVMERNSPVVASGSITVAAKTEPPAPTTVSPQPSLEPPMQQSNEVTPPFKRGRGRPKRSTVGNSPSAVARPAPSGTSNTEMGINRETDSSFPAALCSDSLPSSATVTAVSGSGTIHQFGVCIAPSGESIPPLPSFSPGAQSTPGACIAPSGELIPPLPSFSPGAQSTPGPLPSVVMQVKGQAPKVRGIAESPRRRGKKQAPLPPAIPVLHAPSGTEKTDKIEAVSSFPTATCADSVTSSTTVRSQSSEQGSVSPVVPVLPASSEARKMSMGSEVRSVSINPAVRCPVSFPDAPIVAVSSGTVHQLGVGIAPNFQSNPPLISVAVGSQSISPTLSVSKPSRGRGRKPQSGVEAPRRRGRKQGLVTSVAAYGLGGQETKSNEPPLGLVQVSSGRKTIGSRRKRDNDASELTNVVLGQASEVRTSGGLDGLDAKPAGQPDYLAQNKQHKGFPTSSDGASIASDKITSQTGPIDAKAQETKGPVVEEAVFLESKVSAETQVKKHSILQEALISKPEPSQLEPSLANVDNSTDLVKEDHPEAQDSYNPIMRDAVIFIPETESLEVAKFSKSTRGTGATVITPEILTSEKDVPAEEQEKKDPIQKAVLSKPELFQLEPSLANVGNSRDLVKEDEAEAHDSNNPIMLDEVISLTETKGLEEAKLSKSELGTAAPVVGPEIQKIQKDVSPETREIKDPVLQEAVVSKPEAFQLEPSLANVENSRDLVTEKDPEAQEINYSILRDAVVSMPEAKILKEIFSKSTLETAATVVDPEIQNTEEVSSEILEKKDPILDDVVVSNPEIFQLEPSLINVENSRVIVKENSPEAQESNEPNLQEDVVSKHEIFELEPKLGTGLSMNVENSRDLVEENLRVKTIVDRTSALPANAEPMDDVPRDAPAPDASVLETKASSLDFTVDNGKDKSGKQDLEREMEGRDLDDIAVSEPGETKSYEEKKCSILSTCETSFPVVDPKTENSQKEVYAEAQVSNYPIVQDTAISTPESGEPETKINAVRCQDVADARDHPNDSSTAGAALESPSADSLNVDSLDHVACGTATAPDISSLNLSLDVGEYHRMEDGKEQRLDGSLANEADVPELSMAEIKSLDDEKFRTLEVVAPVVDSKIEKTEHEVNAEAQESKVPVENVSSLDLPLDVGECYRMEDGKECKFKGSLANEADVPELGVAETKSFGEEKISTLNIASPVVDSDFGKTENEVNAEAQQSFPTLQEAVVSEAKVERLEVGLLNTVTDPRDIAKENSLLRTTLDSSSTVPLPADPSENVPVEKPPTADFSVLETAASVSVLTVDKCEDQSGKEDPIQEDRKEHLVVTDNQTLEERKSSILDTTSPNADHSETQLNAGSSENRNSLHVDTGSLAPLVTAETEPTEYGEGHEQ